MLVTLDTVQYTGRQVAAESYVFDIITIITIIMNIQRAPLGKLKQQSSQRICRAINEL